MTGAKIGRGTLDDAVSDKLREFILKGEFFLKGSSLKGS